MYEWLMINDSYRFIEVVVEYLFAGCACGANRYLGHAFEIDL